MLTIKTMRRDFERTSGKFKVIGIYVSLNCAFFIRI